MMFLLDGTIRCSLIPLVNTTEGILIGHFEDTVWENVYELDASHVLREEFLTLSSLHTFMHQAKSTFNRLG